MQWSGEGLIHQHIWSRRMVPKYSCTIWCMRLAKQRGVRFSMANPSQVGYRYTFSVSAWSGKISLFPFLISFHLFCIAHTSRRFSPTLQGVFFDGVCPFGFVGPLLSSDSALSLCPVSLLLPVNTIRVVWCCTDTLVSLPYPSNGIYHHCPWNTSRG